MTVPTSTAKSGPYAGAGTTGPFTVGFRFLENSHLRVIRTSSIGLDSVLALTTDYTVAGAGGASGSITLVTALAVGEKLTVIRNVPFTQLADYVQNDAFPSESHERALDQLTMQTQQLAETAGRALTLPATVSGASTELPSPEAGKLIGWNSSGDGLTNLDSATLATIVAYGTANGDIFTGDGTTTAFNLTASPGLLENLDVAIGGVTQLPGVDYFWTSGTVVTFAVAPPSGVKVLARYMRALAQGEATSGATSYIGPNGENTNVQALAGEAGASLVGFGEGKTISDLREEIGSSLVGFKQAGAGAVERTLQDKARELVSVTDFGSVGDGVTDDTAEVVAGLTDVSGAVGGAQGNEITVTQGTRVLSSTINIPNRVGIVGKNKRGSVLKASASHAGSYMFTVVNGTSSMFDNPLQKLTIDCNDVAWLGGILSSAWQEGGGLRDVLVHKFRTYGVRFQHGYGGAALCEIDQCEIFASATAAATCGIRVDQISAIGSFMLRVTNTTIAGASSFKLPVGIDMVADSLHAQNVHFEDCAAGIQINGPGHHVLIGVTGGPGVTNVVEIASTFTGTLKMIGCLRAGATNLIKDNRAGGYGTIAQDIDVDIRARPIYGVGQVNSMGVFDGTAVSTTYCFGVSNITKNGVGDYTITEQYPRPSAYAIVMASSNVAASGLTVDLIGASSFRIRVYNSSNVLADSNEIKFSCLRAA